MKDKNYIVLQGWMVNQLKLSGNELIVYAIIYGFSQDGQSMFEGSCKYLADSTGATRRSIINILNKLVKKELIKKFESEENGVKYCDYQAVGKFIPKSEDQEKQGGGEKTSQGMKKLHRGCENFSQGGGEKTSHHNTNIYKLEDKEFTTACAVEPETAIIPVSTPPPKKKRTKDLTPDQLALYRAARLCFETSERAKAIMYQDKSSAQRELECVKTLILRCTKIAPDMPESFLKNVLEHFRIMTNGKLKGKAVFTPRALITPWIWELVVDSLPESESPELKDIVRGLFK